MRLPAQTSHRHRPTPNKTGHLGRGWDAKKPPPRMGTARRLAEAYTARIVAPRPSVGRRGNRWAGHDMEHAACATAPANTRESLRPHRRASRHRGFADCIVTQKRPSPRRVRALLPGPTRTYSDLFGLLFVVSLDCQKQRLPMQAVGTQDVYRTRPAVRPLRIPEHVHHRSAVGALNLDHVCFLTYLPPWENASPRATSCHEPLPFR